MSQQEETSGAAGQHGREEPRAAERGAAARERIGPRQDEHVQQPDGPQDQDAAEPLVVLPTPEVADARAEPAPPTHGSQSVLVNSQVLDLVTGRRAEAAPPGRGEEYQQLNLVIHRLLVLGLVLSVALLAAGVGLGFLRQLELPETIPEPREAVRRALQLRPSGFFALGLVMLIVTPIIRVIGSVLVFLYQRDWRYATIALLVLTIMFISVLLGAA